MSGVGPHGGYLLCLFGAHVTQAFGHTPYHVGSSLAGRRDYRDVDVRLMLPDDEFAATFGDDEGKLRVWNLAWTTFGASMTHLPIDFQFQSMTAANAEFDGPRSALIVGDGELPVVWSAGRP